jgi:undecaprenyl pyrophosphate synthase
LTAKTSGKSVLVESFKSIAKKIDDDNLKVNEITESLITDETFSLYHFFLWKILVINNFSLLKLDIFNLKEPDLIIFIGKIESLAGFSPWHLKSSEIL